MAREVRARGASLATGAIAFAAVFAALSVAVAQQVGGSPPTAAAGEPLFKTHCASCHEPAIARAPDRQRLSQLGLFEIINALKNGSMRPMAADLNDVELGEIAAYLS